MKKRKLFGFLIFGIIALVATTSIYLANVKDSKAAVVPQSFVTVNVSGMHFIPSTCGGVVGIELSDGTTFTKAIVYGKTSYNVGPVPGDYSGMVCSFMTLNCQTCPILGTCETVNGFPYVQYYTTNVLVKCDEH